MVSMDSMTLAIVLMMDPFGWGAAGALSRLGLDAELAFRSKLIVARLRVSLER